MLPHKLHRLLRYVSLPKNIRGKLHDLHAMGSLFYSSGTLTRLISGFWR